MVRFGSVRFGSVRFRSVPFGLVRFRSVPFCSVRFGLVRFDSGVLSEKWGVNKEAPSCKISGGWDGWEWGAVVFAG